MRKNQIVALLHCAAVSLMFDAAAQADFHLVKIEQVIAGVNGDITAQAIQLQQRMPLENLVSQGKVVVRDAAGNNGIVVHDLTTDVSNAAQGDRILLITASMAAHLSPAITPDFVITNPIPTSYLAAGTLTRESDFDEVRWRLCWGGDSYTGPTNMPFQQDPDATCAPAWPGALPSATLQALQFQGRASAASNTNEADYALTARAAIFTNNAGTGGTVIAGAPPCPANIVTTGASATKVDVDDLLAVISQWGPCAVPPAACPANIVTSGASATKVDVDDLLAVIGQWGPCPVAR